MYYPFSSVAQYDIDLRHKGKGIILATNFQLPYMSNHSEIRQIEKQEGYKFFKIDDLTITTCNSIRNIHPLYYCEFIPKTMLGTRLLQMIENNFEKYFDWGCKINCFCRPDLCENTGNPGKRYACYKLYR